MGEYPRQGCPECRGPVTCEIVFCNLEEEHERWNCQDDACGEDGIHEDDLVMVHGPKEESADELLDAAVVLRTGCVLPSLVEWV